MCLWTYWRGSNTAYLFCSGSGSSQLWIVLFFLNPWVHFIFFVLYLLQIKAMACWKNHIDGNWFRKESHLIVMSLSPQSTDSQLSEWKIIPAYIHIFYIIESQLFSFSYENVKFSGHFKETDISVESTHWSYPPIIIQRQTHTFLFQLKGIECLFNL